MDRGVPHAQEAEEDPFQTGASKGRGRESGIGGKMVRTKRKKATSATKQKTGAATGEGAVQMGEIADDGLADECKKLMSLVAEKALTGDKNCLQQLVNLAHKTPQGENADAKASGLSQATVWEVEPEWQGESSEEGSETSRASREPENHLN